LRRLNKFFSGLLLLAVILTSCENPSPAGIAPFVYLAEPEYGDYRFIEYYPDEAVKTYIKKQVPGMQYLNSYYDGQKWYVSLSHTFFIYDTLTKQVKELKGYNSNAIKKINGEIWVVTDNGLREDGYSSSLCKINEITELECYYDIDNQQVTDFYIDFDRQIFYASGPGVSIDEDKRPQLKVVQYNMRTGAEIIVGQIASERLANVCLHQFITDEGIVYRETGEKIGEIIGTKGKQLQRYINDQRERETTFLDYEHNLLEVYGCDNNTVRHRRTIHLKYKPSIYPVSHARETTDDGEITLPISEEDDIFSFIGFQSINLRTGEVQVHLFDEPVYKIHAIARFV